MPPSGRAKARRGRLTEVEEEGVDDAWIEVLAGCGPEAPDRLFVWQGGAVGTVGGHRVVRVADPDDARPERDLLAGATVTNLEASCQ